MQSHATRPGLDALSRSVAPGGPTHSLAWAPQANTRVAVYPVEVVADAEEHDDTYAVAVYRSQGPRGEREAVPGVTGIPTEASLARALASGSGDRRPGGLASLPTPSVAAAPRVPTSRFPRAQSKIPARFKPVSSKQPACACSSPEASLVSGGSAARRPRERRAARIRAAGRSVASRRID